MARGVRVTDWLGNQWADCFAKMGANLIKVDDHIVKETKMKLAEAISRAKFVAWTSLHVSITKKWDDLDEQGKNCYYSSTAQAAGTQNRQLRRAHLHRQA